MKSALITGIYGQDGSFLCEKLYAEGYKVYGIARKKLNGNTERIKKELEGEGITPIVFETDLYDFGEISRLVKEIRPTEIYHMAAYHVSSEGKGNGSIIREQELYNKNVVATANILEACYLFSPKTRVLTAGSCLMYDGSSTSVQTEDTAFDSQSLYGLAKISENMLVKYYRNKGIFACTAILYNHESHRRSSNFVTKKIVENLVKIKKGEIQKFSLGSLDIKKDWGFAGDYVDGMILMLHQKIPKDYILSSGELHTIRDFLSVCSKKLGVNDWERFVDISNTIVNRSIQGQLFGNCLAIEKGLGWKRKKDFESLVEEMLEYEQNEI